MAITTPAARVATPVPPPSTPRVEYSKSVPASLTLKAFFAAPLTKATNFVPLSFKRLPNVGVALLIVLTSSAIVFASRTAASVVPTNSPDKPTILRSESLDSPISGIV